TVTVRSTRCATTRSTASVHGSRSVSPARRLFRCWRVEGSFPPHSRIECHSGRSPHCVPSRHESCADSVTSHVEIAARVRGDWLAEEPYNNVERYLLFDGPIR